jgi:NitT/TauT family transport system substrate-binding protein
MIRKSSGRRLGAVVGIALVATLLMACGSDSPSATSSGSSSASASAATGPRAKVTVMEPFTASLGYVLELTAKTRGYFEQENLDVDIQFSRSAGQALQAVLAGQAQIARTGVTNLVQAVTGEQAPVVSIGMPNQQVLYRLVSSSAKPVNTLQDLVGKRIGLPSLGGNAEDTLNILLKEQGIDPTSVDRVAAGFDAAAFGLIEEGQIDALLTNVDIAAILQQQGAKMTIADLGESNPLLGLSYVATKDFTANADVVTRFIRAIDRARTEIEDDSKLDALVVDLNKDWDIAVLDTPDLAKSVIKSQADIWNAAGNDQFLRHVEDRWVKGLDGFAKAGVAPAGLKATDFYTNQFVDAAGH